MVEANNVNQIALIFLSIIAYYWAIQLVLYKVQLVFIN